MKWLPKDRRNPFIIVVLITAAILAGVYLGPIRMQHQTLARLGNARRDANNQLQKIADLVKNEASISNQLSESTLVLDHAERDIASGDLYSWMYGVLRQFQKPYKVEIPEIGQPVVENVDLFASFPYRQVRFRVSGTAYFHDLGKFVAAFENAFPHARIVNLLVNPASSSEDETLSFQMDIIELIKPNSV